MKEKPKSAQECQIIKASRSLAYWSGHISGLTEIGPIMEQLETIFKRGLIDRSDAESVQISDSEAFTQINTHLLELGFLVDDIALDYLERNLTELFNNLVDFIVARKKMDELGLLKVFLNERKDLFDKAMLSYYLLIVQRAIENKALGIIDTGEVKNRVDQIWE